MFRLNWYEEEVLRYLQANPDSAIFKYKSSTYWQTYIHNSRQSITMAMLNKFEKYGLVELAQDGFNKKKYMISEKGKNFKR